MTTLTHAQGARTATARAAPRPTMQARANTGAKVSRPSWLDRLAAWADRQPAHHRMGCWVGFR